MELKEMEKEIDRERLLEIGKVRGKKILDVGVGELTKIAVEKFDCKVICIDMDIEAIKRAVEENRSYVRDGKIKFENYDASNLPYKDFSFDICISWCALHHTPVEKRENFIKELFRVAKEKIIIADFTESGFPHSDDEYKIVNLKWLERKLKKIGKVEKFTDGKIELYICYKQISQEEK
ncbi:MAG: hypothetical protein DRI28_06325 [Caldiserica bacterium]|nr:MAG: hypothetical protein DRI28_06325 [Caldisericota bacterium]